VEYTLASCPIFRDHLSQPTAVNKCRYKRVKIACVGCGIEFKVKPSESDRKYCNEGCYKKHHNDKSKHTVLGLKKGP